MITSVVSYHHDPQTCGVARFNHELAARLNVPMVGINGEWGDFPLLSLKWGEIKVKHHVDLLTRCEQREKAFGLFWHDEGFGDVSELAKWVVSGGPHLPGLPLWCPGAPLPQPEPPSDVKVFSFGMAHKLHANPYRRITELLKVYDKSIVVRVSVGIHEGTSLDDAAMHFGALADIFGPDRVRVQGCLSDMALREELERTQIVAAFFPGGAKANNTTIHTAMSLGKPVLTNLGPDSPREFQHGVNVMDVFSITLWPTWHEWHEVGQRGLRLYETRFAWPLLIARIQDVAHAHD